MTVNIKNNNKKRKERSGGETKLISLSDLITAHETLIGDNNEKGVVQSCCDRTLANESICHLAIECHNP